MFFFFSSEESVFYMSTSPSVKPHYRAHSRWLHKLAFDQTISWTLIISNSCSRRSWWEVQAYCLPPFAFLLPYVDIINYKNKVLRHDIFILGTVDFGYHAQLTGLSKLRLQKEIRCKMLMVYIKQDCDITWIAGRSCHARSTESGWSRLT